MSASEDIRELESELEEHKRDLHEDAIRISNKIEETRARLSPRRVILDRPMLTSFGALLVGFIVGYFLDRRKGAPSETIAALTSAGRAGGRDILTSLGQNVIRPVRRTVSGPSYGKTEQQQ